MEMKAYGPTAIVVGGGAGSSTALAGMAPIDLARWMIWPAVTFTIVFFVVPIIMMVAVSFWVRSGGALLPEWTVQNYVKFFTRDYLLTALRNSIEVTVLTTALSVIVAYPLAYVLAFHIPERWQKIVLVAAVLPFWTSYVVRSYSWLLVIGDKGILNNLLLDIGLVYEPLKLAYTRFATVLGFVHFFVMLLTLTIYANLIQISPSYLKAAQDLGASTLGVIWHVILPLSLPGVAVGAFLTFVITIGDYVTPQILGGNTEVLVPQAIMLQIVRTADVPMAATLALVLMAAVIAVYLVFQRYLKMDRV
jgi:spermidine/putrescine transport system permease protein